MKKKWMAPVEIGDVVKSDGVQLLVVGLEYFDEMNKRHNWTVVLMHDYNGFQKGSLGGMDKAFEHFGKISKVDLMELFSHVIDQHARNQMIDMLENYK